MNNQPLLDTIDPEIVDRLVDRKEEIDNGSSARPGVAAALALGSIPIALAALSRDAYGQGLPANIKAVLDFALALEIFEAEFYKAVLNKSSSSAQNSAFATVRAKVTDAAVLATLDQIRKHEEAHVSFLQANGATNVFNLNADSFDFTGGRGSGTGPFREATTDVAMLLQVAQGAEDTGVRAYKGQAGNLMPAKAVLEAALRIHSVEARHASRIRRIRRLAAGAPAAVLLSGTVRGDGAAAAGGTTLGTTNPAGVTAAFSAIYAGEGNTTQGPVNVATLTGANFGTEAAQEAFDEALDRAAVVAIVQPFFIPTIS